MIDIIIIDKEMQIIIFNKVKIEKVSNKKISL